MNEPLRQTLIDAAKLLQSQRLNYALIGGLAVSMRGQTRVTADVDLVIAAELDRALQLVDQLDGTVFRPLFDDVSQVIQRAFILPLQHRRTKVKVDVSIGLSGFERQAIGRAEPLDVAGTLIPVATAEDLIVMKALAGRPQDDQDVRGLVLVQGDRVDWEYCFDTAAKLGEALDLPLETRVRALREISV